MHRMLFPTKFKDDICRIAKKKNLEKKKFRQNGNLFTTFGINFHKWHPHCVVMNYQSHESHP